VAPLRTGPGRLAVAACGVGWVGGWVGCGGRGDLWGWVGYVQHTAAAHPTPVKQHASQPTTFAPHRLLLEVVDAVVAAVGHDKVGIRLSPFNK